MWLLWLITLLNGVANNKTFLEWRLTFGGVPINIFDFLMFVGLFWAVFLPNPHRFPVDRTHPALKWTLAFLFIGAFGGFIGSLSNGAWIYDVLNIGRNYLTIPIGIFVGYQLLGQLKSARRFIYVHIIAGLFTAFMILLFFQGQLGLQKSMHNVNIMRTVNYISSYSGTGALFLFACVILGHHAMPMLLAWLCGLMMIIGQFATISRSEWVATGIGMVSIIFLIRWRKRAYRLLVAVLVLPLVLAALYGSVQLVSRIGGWNFGAKIDEKIASLIPDDSNKDKAWDTRLPSALREIQIWRKHPFLGAGFGAQAVEERARLDPTLGGFYHNAWTSTAAHAGIFGLIGMSLCAGTSIWIGRKMALDRSDDESTLFGIFAFVSGVFFVIYGASTLSFNTLRGGIPFALVCGMTLRVRAIQLTQKRMQAELEAYYAEHPELLYEASEEAYAHNVQEPVFGNWYGSN